MKEMSKAKISLKKSIKSVANERKFLEKFHFNLLCNMYYAFQDDDTLYIIMDYLSGGDLRYMICRRNFFTEEETKFIAACITLNLNYIHDKNVIHRDIKPENLVFGANGYLHLTDFGIALEYHRGENGVRSASGTPGYMAPEAITNKRQEFSVDYFALGVIVYELMLGERPYQGKNRKEIKEQMMNLEIKLDKDDLPEDWKDENIIDFINKLLERKKKKRLGFKTDLEVKNHPYFNNISFDLIENMKFESPFIFDTEDNFDDSYAQMQENDSIYEGNKEIFIDEVNESNMFKDFYYNIEDILIQNNQIAEGKENKTKTDLTSKTSNKKNGEDTSIVIHNIKSKKNKRRKSAKFIGIQPDEDKKVVNVIRKGNKSGSLRLNLNKVDDD
jgi:serum/glucocorticoid-regulated kinase 2